MTASEIAQTLRASAGVQHKRDIQHAFAALTDLHAAPVCRVGDDCAAIPDGSGYLLFAIEGLLEAFVAAEPWFAGYCAVMVNVSDIYAMGGRPVALVDALWSADAQTAGETWAGMQAAAAAYGVPIVGGHTNTRSSHAYLAAAIVGRAEQLLTSFDARPDDVLLAAIDLRGAYYNGYDYWNASTSAPPQRLRDDLDVMVSLAADGICRAAKDISMGGILGTLLMLAECSGVGASVDIDAIPLPPGTDLARWLRTFPSYGFLLSARPEQVDEACERFARRDIACVPIGTLTGGPIVEIAYGAEVAPLWNFATATFIGARVYA